jgi:hypothetical protein
VLGNQIQCRNVTTPSESKLHRKNPRFRLGTSAWRERQHGADTPLDGSCSKCCPTSEAVSHDSNLSGSHPLGGRVPGLVSPAIGAVQLNCTRSVLFNLLM